VGGKLAAQIAKRLGDAMSLREKIMEKHKQAEHHRFAKLLLSGKISTDIYGNYLFNLSPCYNLIERQAKFLGVLEGIEGIMRSPRMDQDIKELVFTPTIVPATLAYIEYLEALDDPQRVLAHLYVRHFGDLFGGQLLKTVVPSTGRMYEFEDRSQLIEKARGKLHEGLAAEANVAFDYAIAIFEDLADVFNIQNP
jgi:heme oxygenase